MSVDPFPDSAWEAMTPQRRATRARLREERRLVGAIDDFFLGDDVRLDDRTRMTLARLLRSIVETIEADIRRHAARLLSGRGATARAEAMLTADGDVATRLARSGLLRDVELMDELIAGVRQDGIADALPGDVADDEAPSLLVRLTDVPDTVVAAAARALLAADSRRRATAEDGDGAAAGLPAELHHRMLWWVAAAIREAIGVTDPDQDRAIAEAALRSLAAHDEGERPDSAAMRLAIAIDARPDEIAPLLIDALGDRRLSLFVAVLAHALSIEADQARAIVLEAEGDRLWLALRALGLDRAAIATIGLALADADPRRDIEQFADRLDAIAAVDRQAARAAIAPLSLPRDFRAAIRAIERSDRR